MKNQILASVEQITQIESKEDSEPPDSPAALGSFTISENKRHQLIKTEPVQLGSFFIGPDNLKIEITSDIETCKKIWHELSPQKTLFDTWEFRYAFYLAYGFLPYFLVLKSNTENLALLPLWYDSEEKKYVWFGSTWQEEVRFFTKDFKYIPLLLQAAPSPLLLNALSLDSARPVGQMVELKPDEAKYILNLKEFSTHEDYLATLKKNGRHSLRKDRRRIEGQNPEIIINDFSYFEQLVALARKRFSQKEEPADWEDKRRIETFRQVIKLSGASYQARMITIKIGDKIAAVDLICLLNDTYFAVKCGYNVAEFPGVGNYMNLIEIDDAIKLGMKKIDFLQNNYTWKSRWFEAIPLFKYEK
jgi:hypothetical protein